MGTLINIIVVLSCCISVVLCPVFTKGYKPMYKVDFILLCSVFTPFLGIPIFFATHKKK